MSSNSVDAAERGEGRKVAGAQASLGSPALGWAERLLLNPVILFAAIFGVLILRSPDAFRFPELAYEDGNQMLGFFFNSPDARSALRLYNGYVQLVPNFVAWLATQVPISLAPPLFTAASAALAALGFFLVSRSHFAWLIPNAVDRAVVALLLVLLPLGKSYVVYNVAYSLWSCLFLLIVLVAGPLPRSKPALVLTALGIILCILSHPLSLLVLPILILHLILDKRGPQRLWLCGFIATIIAYQIFLVEHGNPVHATLSTVHLSVKLFLSRVVFETVLGSMAATALLPDHAQVVHAFAVTLLSGLAFLTLTNRSPVWPKFGVVVAVGLAFGIILASTAARLESGPDTPHLFKFYLQRYFYVPKLIIATLILAQLVTRLRLAWPSIAPTALAVLLFGSAVYLVGLNRSNNRLYHNSHAEGVRIAEFLRTVQNQIQAARAGQPYQVEWVLPREPQPGWDIKLNIDQHLGKAPAAIGRTGAETGAEK